MPHRRRQRRCLSRWRAHAVLALGGRSPRPNITPDLETGIGGWSDEDFVRALRDGKSPRGRTYYPAFPYTAYAGMRREDMLDLKAYLDAVEPVVAPNKPHELRFPFSVRLFSPSLALALLRSRAFPGRF